MPYRVHLRNRETPKPINIAGVLIDTRIVPETPALQIVETIDDAKTAILGLVKQGVPLGDLYAVGWDHPPPEQIDS